MDLEGIMLSEVSKTKKDKSNTIWFPLHVGSKEQNKWTNKIETNLKIQRTDVTSWEAAWGLGEQGEGIKKNNLLGIKTVMGI